MTLPVHAYKLPGISPRAYQHPADRAATAALGKVPYLDDVVRKLIALGYERALRAASLGAAVRLGQHQLPHIWVLHREAFNALDIEQVPDLYMTQFPLANAATIGVDKPVVLLNSELVRLLDDEGRRAVLAHEAAHVHSDHVLYQTALHHPHPARRRGAVAPASPACRSRRSSSRCSSGFATPSCPATAPRRSSRATRSRCAAR